MLVLSLSIPASSLAGGVASRRAAEIHSIKLPPRAAGALTGSKLARMLVGLDETERERSIIREVVSGNIPTFLRRLRPVVLRGVGGQKIVVWVTPDYLAVGSDRDFVRVPLGLDAAVEVARRLHLVLPTTRIVDAVYVQADHRLEPRPMSPGPQMVTVPYFVQHNRTVELQRRGIALGQLIAGHKKDVVLTDRLAFMRGRVAIYGWHRDIDQPIQPLSTVHRAGYSDYSHGVRLVSEIATVDGRPRQLLDLLESPDWAPVVSDEGTQSFARALLGSKPFSEVVISQTSGAPRAQRSGFAMLESDTF